MPLTRPTYDIDNVQKLSDLVQDQAAAVKQAFDKSSADTRTFLSEVLIPEVEELVKQSLPVPDGGLEDIKLSNGQDGIKQRFNAHLAEIATVVVSINKFPIGALENDDTARVQRAIDYLDSLGGGELIFPKGTYIISNRILLKSNITLRGLTGSKLKLADNIPLTIDGATNWNGATILWLESISNVKIQGLDLDGNQTNQQITAAGIFNGIQVKSCEGVTVDGCTIHDMQHAAIQVTGIAVTPPDNYVSKGAWYLTVKNNKFYNILHALQLTESDSHNVIFSGNYVNNAYSHGMSAYPGTHHLEVSNNIIRNVGMDTSYNGSGIRIFESVDVVISGNIVENPEVHGIYINTNSPVLHTTCERINITGNIVLGGDRLGLAGDGIAYVGENINISGNSVYDFTAYSGSVGIRGTGKNCTISGNLINNVNNGISLNGDNCAITGNAVIDALTYGILVGNFSTSTVTITGNTVGVVNKTCLVALRIYGYSTGSIVSSNKVTGATNYKGDDGVDTVWVKATTIKSAAPTSGTWKVGDIVYNAVPVVGGYIGWVCVTAGTPGTWKGFGLIQA